MEKVRAKKGAVDWFRTGITIGEIYDFPTITFDGGRSSKLNPNREVWRKEFEFDVVVEPVINNNYSII